MIEIKKILNKPMVGQAQSNPEYLWIIIACVPLLFQLPFSSVPVWALGLVLGGWIANKHPLRWIALAWLISIFFPTMPLLILACSGAILKNWRYCIYAAVLGSVLSLIPIPGELKNTGTILIMAGLILIIYRRVKLFKGAHNETD